MVIKSVFLILSVALAAMGFPSDKIVGGHFAEDNQFPHQIGLFYTGNFRCGGSIIDQQWVLTAAHCVLDGINKIPPSQLAVYAGSSNLAGDGHFFEVEDTFAHELYGEFQHDIALIKLKEKIEFDESMQKIELNTEELEESDAVTISGFGRIGTGMDISEQLKYATMYVLREKDCYQAAGFVSKGLICFNNAVDNGACNGDSGGPAVHDGKLVGVANFVISACGTQYPDGYAKVAYYVDWIKQTIESY
ncbi:serine protease SP24D [Aedes aegypti]|uniref:Uncharacterized protein n=1 Tax=Aedes aegypti TaxID=7159 RepID=A0A1S4FKR3_AEDAE|nr:serine protease SP24D [Aedes aegypti]